MGEITLKPTETKKAKTCIKKLNAFLSIFHVHKLTINKLTIPV